MRKPTLRESHLLPEVTERRLLCVVAPLWARHPSSHSPVPTLKAILFFSIKEMRNDVKSSPLLCGFIRLLHHEASQRHYTKEKCCFNLVFLAFLSLLHNQILRFVILLLRTSEVCCGKGLRGAGNDCIKWDSLSFFLCLFSKYLWKTYYQQFADKCLMVALRWVEAGSPDFQCLPISVV